nr:MAG TPA: PROTEIN/DNA Complex catalytic motif, Helix-turn-helix DNA [Caudoviricetes sp.]
MTWECLDFIHEDYAINEMGEVKRLSKDCLTNISVDKNGNRICYINRAKFRVDKLVAEMFVLNPHGYSIVGHKDGNKENCMASNLVWVPNQKAIQFLSAKKSERKKDYANIRAAINDAIDANNWQLATELGKQLPFNEDNAIRPMFSNYTPLNPKTRMKTSSPILRVWTVEEGTINYCSTKEVTEKYGIRPSTVYQRYTNPPKEHKTGVIYLELVAMVSKYFVNAKIDVLLDGLIIDSGSYTEICQQYNIHLEDLVDLLYSNDSDKILYNGLEFRMSSGQNKAPAIHGKEV